MLDHESNYRPFHQFRLLLRQLQSESMRILKSRQPAFQQPACPLCHLFFSLHTQKFASDQYRAKMTSASTLLLHWSILSVSWTCGLSFQLLCFPLSAYGGRWMCEGTVLIGDTLCGRRGTLSMHSELRTNFTESFESWQSTRAHCSATISESLHKVSQHLPGFSSLASLMSSANPLLFLQTGCFRWTYGEFRCAIRLLFTSVKNSTIRSEVPVKYS